MDTLSHEERARETLRLLRNYPLGATDDLLRVLEAAFAAVRAEGVREGLGKQVRLEHERRYLHDASYHALVHEILVAVRRGPTTFTDIRAAVYLAERLAQEKG